MPIFYLWKSIVFILNECFWNASAHTICMSSRNAD